VGSINITVRFGEDELRRLDELAERMGKTRSDAIRDLINKFDETLKQEVEKERRRWMLIGFVSALEEAILDPELVLRFIRKNVDILGYPDFLIGMTKVRNRVVVFSHHDKVGDQLLRLVRAKIEEEVKREEMEIEQEEGEDEGGGGVKAIQVRIPVSKPIKPSAPHAAPGSHRYKILVSSRNAPAVGRTTAVAVANRSGSGSGSGGAEATANTSVVEKQKLASTGLPIAGDSTGSQTRNTNSRAVANGGDLGLARPVGQGLEDRRGGGSGRDMPSPVGQGANHGLSGDFVVSLITNLYHKHRDALLKAVEDVMGG
jgi:Arc/MetJ-type ribon-helix-helix transcriptional regulator